MALCYKFKIGKLFFQRFHCQGLVMCLKVGTSARYNGPCHVSEDGDILGLVMCLKMGIYWAL